MSRRPLEWPVYTFDRNGIRHLGWFDYAGALDCVRSQKPDEPNRYIGEPRYIDTACADCGNIASLDDDGLCACCADIPDELAIEHRRVA